MFVLSFFVMITFYDFASFNNFGEDLMHDLMNISHVILDPVNICLGSLIRELFTLSLQETVYKKILHTFLQCP